MTAIPDGTSLRDAKGRVKYVRDKGAWYRPATDSIGLPELEHVDDQAAAEREARELVAK